MRTKQQVTPIQKLIKHQYNNCEGLAHLLISACTQCDNLGNYYPGMTLNEIFQNVFIKKFGVQKLPGMLVDVIENQKKITEILNRKAQHNGGNEQNPK